jgi:two-component system chemotaxis response regulator CheB
MKAEFDKPVALTCPDCGGAFATSKMDGLTEFRCHIGHVYSGEAMVAAQLLEMDRFIESAVRLLNERADLCRQMAQDASAMGHAGSQAIWIKAMKEAFDLTEPLEEFLAHKWLHPAVGDAGKTKSAVS